MPAKILNLKTEQLHWYREVDGQKTIHPQLEVLIVHFELNLKLICFTADTRLSTF